jgi:predicted metal-dependent RNase
VTVLYQIYPDYLKEKMNTIKIMENKTEEFQSPSCDEFLGQDLNKYEPLKN